MSMASMAHVKLGDHRVAVLNEISSWLVVRCMCLLTVQFFVVQQIFLRLGKHKSRERVGGAVFLNSCSVLTYIRVIRVPARCGSITIKAKNCDAPRPLPNHTR